MQSGKAKYNNWFLEFDTKDNSINPLMGWESSTDTLSEIKLEFPSKELAIIYAKKNNIDYEVLETSERKVINKSYADNFK